MPECELPKGFQDLECFTAYWVSDTSHQRLQQRSQASMAEIRTFYDAMLARAEDAIAYCDQYPLGDMPATADRLMKLLLALGQAAVAVEMHGQPRAHHSVWPNAITVTTGPAPYGTAA